MAAARKKASKKRTGSKAKSGPDAGAAGKRAKPRSLPDDDAWRKLIETAVEKADPVESAMRRESAPDTAKKKATRK